MKAFKILLAGMVLFSAFAIQSCKKDDDKEEIKEGLTFTQNATLNLSFSHLYKSQPLKKDPYTYVTSSEDTIRIAELRYYITNVTLTNDAGATVNLKNHNLVISGSEKDIVLKNIPEGNYKKISFLIGVDSAVNHDGTQQGDLDPAYGMFWTWNTGYIYFRINGFYSSANKDYSFDIGGLNNLMKKEFDLTSYKVSGSTAKISISTEVSNVFDSPRAYDLKTNVNMIHSATASAALEILKPNVSGMFSVKSVQ